MTDRELLELAAKAAGMGLPSIEDFDEIGRQYCESLGLWVQRPWGWGWWNPLTDDGDALRLAVKLRITIDLTDCVCCVRVASNELDGENEDFSIRHSPEFRDCEVPDAMAATRRAIVRAAAALGEKQDA
jgi:hypothetical protein